MAVLVLLSLAQFVIALDYSIIYVALPSIAADLHLAPAAAQWVVSAYAVLFAGFLVLGGRICDRVGARRLFIVAVAAFGLASAAGAAAADGTVLLAARGGQGLCAALLQPAVLGLIGTTWPAGPARSRAVAVWGSIGATGLAAGAILGGLLTTASWRLTFLLSVPLTLACALGAAAWIAPDRVGPDQTGPDQAGPDQAGPDQAGSDRSAPGRAAVGGSAAGATVPRGGPVGGRIPAVAAVLGTGTALALVLGLTLGAGYGWRAPATLGCLGLAAVFGLGFVRNERTARDVLIDPVLRRTRSLRVGAAATALYMASVGSEFYLLTLLLQAAKGYRPLRAGLAFLPLALLVTAGSVAAGRAVRRLAPATVLTAGFGIAAAGLLWLTVTLTGPSYAVDLLPGIVLSGLGHGLIYTSMFIIGTHDVPRERQGTAGALLTTAQYLAGAITLALLTLLLGPTPTAAGFRPAFALITAAAIAGLALAGITGRAGRIRVTHPSGSRPIPSGQRTDRTCVGG
ncbi:MAG TPA: MFS transporter [Mycobacteriales bacterium]|nr:MFS transporter [Mycobacteriales bacterium]